MTVLSLVTPGFGVEESGWLYRKFLPCQERFTHEWARMVQVPAMYQYGGHQGSRLQLEAPVGALEGQSYEARRRAYHLYGAEPLRVTKLRLCLCACTHECAHACVCMCLCVSVCVCIHVCIQGNE